MLSRGRIQLQGQSRYPWETEGLKFIREQLPDQNPFQMWELVELPDPATGRLHEIDCLVLGYDALYVVEMKGGPGLYEGDTTDWYRTGPGDPRRYMDPPFRLTNHKAKVLKGLLERKFSANAGVRVPYVQALVFLSAEEVALRFRNFGEQGVVTRKDIVKALQFHQFPGADGQRTPARVTMPQAREVVAALQRLGVRPSKGSLRVTSYELGEVLEEGPGYEDREAEHSERKHLKRRARIYLVPSETSTERRQTLLRAADREVQLLEDVKEHPNVLRLAEYVTDAPLGPTVLFDHFDGIPLDAFLRDHPDLSFYERAGLIEQIANTVAHCHRKKVLHGALSPSAVLVRRGEDGALSIRLYNFQLGTSDAVSSTVHWSSLAATQWSAYQAPELRESLASRAPLTDMFSVGALAYLILTGRAPGADGAEVDRRLEADHALDPRAVNDEIPPKVAEAIKFATDLRPLNRFDDVQEWLTDSFLDAVTQSEAKEPELEVDPLKAKKGDVLTGDLEVVRVLGQGASSRVLEVEDTDERHLALKVALTHEDDDRLRDEGRFLTALRHPRIVRLEGERVIAGRTCLLMALAGESTLRVRLRKEGPLSLDFAARFGEDLLLALEQLAEDKLLHRDIKPDNLGVGTVSRKAQHLVLFDFSLGLDLTDQEAVSKSRSQLHVGTTGYRDPFLRQRGQWDPAADRFSAAVTLHEMLTGVTPTWLPEGVPAWAPEATLSLAAERFDPAVREQLVAFFERALARESDARFESAEAMRKAWNHAFEVPARVSVVDTPQAEPSEPSWETLDLGQIAPDAAIASLPLPSRALNALDRAGLLRVGDLLQLPDNRLSAVRGVGTRVAKEILRFRDAWRAATKTSEQEVAPFFPGYAADALRLAEADLSAELVRLFEDAGLSTLAAVASAPKVQVEGLLERATVQPKVLLERLQTAQAKARDRDHPTTLDGWLEALLPKQPKRRGHLLAVFGLSAPFEGQLDVTLTAVAKALGMTPANLSIMMSKASEAWAGHPAFTDLAELVHATVEGQLPALPLEQAAERVLVRLAAAKTDDAQNRCKAAALIRMVCEVEKQDPTSPRWIRLHGRPWLVRDDSLTTVLRVLGTTADALASRSVLASSGEAVRELRAGIEHTPFEPLDDEALTQLATAASQRACRSSRLEIYPRGLPATRALELTSSVLAEQVSPETLQALVVQRYPEAEPLPERPALDALLGAHEFEWNPTDNAYRRRGTTSHSGASSTYTQLPTRFGTPRSTQRAINPEVVEVHEFEEQIAISIERSSVRVLGVSRTYSHTAALLLCRRFGLELVDLDRLLLGRLFAHLKQEDIQPDLVFATDLAGPQSEDWPYLTRVMREVASSVAKDFLPFKKPTLLVQPGLLARFGLSDFLLELIEKAASPGSAATLLLVPGAHEGAAEINGTLPIPQVGLPNTLRVSEQWISQYSDQAA